jgi:pimeloyl-ACP methyl ester carboxylesterase
VVPTLTTDGATVAYTDTGAPADHPGARTIVFGHGLLFSGWMFRDQIAALRDTYRCVTIDWRGQGESPAAASGYDMDTLAADARALLEHLAVGPVHYAGLSMGGFVGQRLAARHPELIRSLTLLDTSAKPEERFAAVQDKALSLVFRAFGIAPVQRSVVKIMFGPTFRAGPRYKQVLAEWLPQLAKSERAGMRQAVLAVANRRGIIDEIGKITAPTLVIVGADDKPTPVARAKEIAAAIPGARLEIVADSGHSSTIEQPEAVTALIREFVTGVDAAPVD